MIMSYIQLIINGLWNNIFNKEIIIDQYRFKVWVVLAFFIILALIFRFLGATKEG